MQSPLCISRSFPTPSVRHVLQALQSIRDYLHQGLVPTIQSSQNYRFQSSQHRGLQETKGSSPDSISWKSSSLMSLCGAQSLPAVTIHSENHPKLALTKALCSSSDT